MSRILTASLLSSGGLLFSTHGVAHPGTDHGMPLREGMAHLLTQPDHLLMILGAGLFAAIMLKSFLVRRATARKHRDK